MQTAIVEEEYLIDTYTDILTAEVEKLDIKERVMVLNKIREKLHSISPFKSEPVDCVLWVENSEVFANDYNPNSVAPPEMELGL